MISSLLIDKIFVGIISHQLKFNSTSKPSSAFDIVYIVHFCSLFLHQTVWESNDYVLVVVL